jgi:hypothetical protein
MINRHALTQSLMMEGRAETDRILAVPEKPEQWVSYQRYHAKEKSVSNSYQRRHALFLEKKKQAAAGHEAAKQPIQYEETYRKTEAFVYLKILCKNKPLFAVPVVEKKYPDQHKPAQALRLNSWGLVTAGALPVI